MPTYARSLRRSEKQRSGHEEEEEGESRSEAEDDDDNAAEEEDEKEEEGGISRPATHRPRPSREVQWSNLISSSLAEVLKGEIRSVTV